VLHLLLGVHLLDDTFFFLRRDGPLGRAFSFFFTVFNSLLILLHILNRILVSIFLAFVRPELLGKVLVVVVFLVKVASIVVRGHLIRIGGGVLGVI